MVHQAATNERLLQICNILSGCCFYYRFEIKYKKSLLSLTLLAGIGGFRLFLIWVEYPISEKSLYQTLYLLKYRGKITTINSKND